MHFLAMTGATGTTGRRAQNHRKPYVLRKLKRTALLLRLRRMIAWHRLKRLSPGSTSWFIEAEIKFGGLVTNIVRNRLSPHDPRVNDRFVYFIEDNDTIFDDVRTLYPAYRIEKYGELTILSRSPSS